MLLDAMARPLRVPFAEVPIRVLTRMALSGLNPFSGLVLRRFQRVNWGVFVVAMQRYGGQSRRSFADTCESGTRAERSRHRSIDAYAKVVVAGGESVVPP